MQTYKVIRENKKIFYFYFKKFLPYICGMKRTITHHIYTANLLEFRDCAYVYMIDEVCNISYNSVFFKRKSIVFSDLEHLLILINECKLELNNHLKSNQ